GPNYLASRSATIVKGRNFSPLEAEERAPVCLISEGTEKTFFPNGALGQSLYLEDTPWQVIGVYSRGPRGKNSFRVGDGDVEMLAPLQALMRSSKELSIQSIEVRVKPDVGPSAKADLQKAVERDDPKRTNLFMVRDQKDFYARSLDV